MYDYGYGNTPSLGGTTTMVYNEQTGKLERQYLSLAGTVRNCAGGPTPWGSWLTCEETYASQKDGENEQNHGYVLDRKSVVSGKSVSVRVDLGGRRVIKKKKR